MIRSVTAHECTSYDRLGGSGRPAVPASGCRMPAAHRRRCGASEFSSSWPDASPRSSGRGELQHWLQEMTARLPHDDRAPRTSMRSSSVKTPPGATACGHRLRGPGDRGLCHQDRRPASGDRRRQAAWHDVRHLRPAGGSPGVPLVHPGSQLHPEAGAPGAARHRRDKGARPGVPRALRHRLFRRRLVCPQSGEQPRLAAGGEARRQDPLLRLRAHLQSPGASGRVFRRASGILLAHRRRAPRRSLPALLHQPRRDPDRDREGSAAHAGQPRLLRVLGLPKRLARLLPVR